MKMRNDSMDKPERILIVDDDVGIGLLLQRELKKSGFTAHICLSGREALDWLSENEPALMLVDLDLPDILGQDLLRKLEERGRTIPFIVVSGIGDLRVVVEMMRKGALDFVMKDAAMLDLVGPTVENVLRHLEVRRELKQAQGRLFHITKATSDVFWMLDARMEKFLYVSPSYEKIWGRSREKIYQDSQEWLAGVVEEDRSKIIRAMEALREGYEEEFDKALRIKKGSGEVRWIRARAFTTRDEMGNALCFSGVTTDITERKDLERQVIEATELERLRIGRDLHDDLCQRLAVLKLSCARVEVALEREESAQADEVRRIEESLGQATAVSRAIARGLSPVSLDSGGLMVALEEFAGTIEERFNIPCRFDCPEPVEVASPASATNIFRIAQELLNNAARHGRASRIHLGLYHAPGGIALEVVNDGVPFRGPTKKGRGMGVRFMEFRADALGASLDFFPGKVPGGGTRVVCTIPEYRLEENAQLNEDAKIEGKESCDRR